MMQEAAKFEFRNSKLEDSSTRDQHKPSDPFTRQSHTDANPPPPLHLFEFRISDFEFRGDRRVAA